MSKYHKSSVFEQSAEILGCLLVPLKSLQLELRSQVLGFSSILRTL